MQHTEGQCSCFTYTTVQVWCQFNVFKRSLLSSPRLHLFDQKYSKNSNIVKYYYHLKELFSICKYFSKCNLFLWSNLNFQHHSVFSVTWSFRNHSNMMIWCFCYISDYYQCWKQPWHAGKKKVNRAHDVLIRSLDLLNRVHDLLFCSLDLLNRAHDLLICSLDLLNRAHDVLIRSLDFLNRVHDLLFRTIYYFFPTCHVPGSVENNGAISYFYGNLDTFF